MSAENQEEAEIHHLTLEVQKVSIGCVSTECSWQEHAMRIYSEVKFHCAYFGLHRNATVQK